MNEIYPIGREYLCPSSKNVSCSRYKDYPILCDDSICRKSKDLQPSKIVCPIGAILCADLSCKENINDCYFDYPQCKSKNKKFRCPTQECVSFPHECYTTITCKDPNHYVCPDGTCVENEIFCPSITVCPKEQPYLCTFNFCAKDVTYCPRTQKCGNGQSLCNDKQCRKNCNI